MIQIQLVNAQEMAKQYPDSFTSPDQEELSKVSVGDSVKVCVNNEERLWVEVTAVNGDGKFKGNIDNCPVVVDFLSLGDPLSFKAENIYEIFN